MIAEYQTVEKALAYLAIADSIPERTRGEKMVLDLIPSTVTRVLDLGTGDGRLLGLVRQAFPNVEGCALDFSQTMIEKALERFQSDSKVSVRYHDLNDSIAAFGKFDAIVSSFAIHHLEDHRKLDLYEEVYNALNCGGVFVNLEHVSSPTEHLHDEFLAATGITRDKEDKSNRCSPLSTQLLWLEQVGFSDVDCYWKWRELAVLAGIKPFAASN